MSNTSDQLKPFAALLDKLSTSIKQQQRIARQENLASSVTDTLQNAIDALSSVSGHVDILEQLADRVSSVTRIPSNGYRSFVQCYRNVLMALDELFHQCHRAISSGQYPAPALRRVDQYCSWLAYFGKCSQYLCEYSYLCCEGHLTPTAVNTYDAQYLWSKLKNMQVREGHDIILGLHFNQLKQRQIMLQILACYVFNHYFYSTGGTASRVINVIRSLWKLVTGKNDTAHVMRFYASRFSINYLKALGYVADLLPVRLAIRLMKPRLAVNELIGLTPKTLSMNCVQSPSRIAYVHPPCVIGSSGEVVRCRSMSYKRRSGMVSRSSWLNRTHATSDALIIHCHGGGFVIGSSRGHEFSLRDWAQQTDVPMFTIDYSLAPKYKFDHACKEVFYAYCWALTHCHLIGSTAQHVVVIGDSSGATLLFNVVIECIKRGIRKPDAMLLLYPAVNIGPCVTPSSFLGSIELGLPLYMIITFLEACQGKSSVGDDEKDDIVMVACENDNYFSPKSNSSDKTQDTDYITNLPPLPHDKFLSNEPLVPCSAESLGPDRHQIFSEPWQLRLSDVSNEVLAQFPQRVSVMVGEFDPLLDESVMLTWRLRSAAIPVELRVFESVSHNFIFTQHLNDISERTYHSVIRMIQHLVTRQQGDRT